MKAHVVCTGLIVMLLGILTNSACSQQGTQGSNSQPSTSASYLSLGTYTVVNASMTCPNNFYGTNASFTPSSFNGDHMHCSQITINCNGTQPENVVIGYQNPAVTPVLGTIFTHGGLEGLAPFNAENSGSTDNYVHAFLNAGYRVVQIAWNPSAGQTSNGVSDWGTIGNGFTSNLQVAACRPATVMRYVYDNIHGGESGTGAFCSIGHSAGSGAIAYSLAHYGAGDATIGYLDKAILMAGPPLSDLSQGCKITNGSYASNVTVCPAGQMGCSGGMFSSIMDFQTGAQTLISSWSGDSTCAIGTGSMGSPAGSTSVTSNNNWKAMSIVDDTSNPSFSYPKTALSGWVCNTNGNNHAGEAQIFYDQFVSSNQTYNGYFSLNVVGGGCNPENIWTGTTVVGAQNGFLATVGDMTDSTVGCIKHH